MAGGEDPVAGHLQILVVAARRLRPVEVAKRKIGLVEDLDEVFASAEEDQAVDGNDVVEVLAARVLGVGLERLYAGAVG